MQYGEKKADQTVFNGCEYSFLIYKSSYKIVNRQCHVSIATSKKFKIRTQNV